MLCAYLSIKFQVMYAWFYAKAPLIMWRWYDDICKTTTIQLLWALNITIYTAKTVVWTSYQSSMIFILKIFIPTVWIYRVCISYLAQYIVHTADEGVRTSYRSGVCISYRAVHRSTEYVLHTEFEAHSLGQRSRVGIVIGSKVKSDQKQGDLFMRNNL